MTEAAGGDRAAVLVVDVQRAAIERRPYREETVLGNIAELIAACRTAGIEVIYVQHDGDPGSAYEPGTSGWEIAAPVSPEDGEKIVRKRFNSAFRKTDLRDYLEERGIGTLILTGLQTEYCVDATCKVAFEHGFDVVLPEMTNTTYDNGELGAEEIYDLYNRRILDGRFGAVRSMADTLRAIRNGGSFAEVDTT